MAGGDLDIPEVDTSIEHGRDLAVTQHVGVCTGNPDASGLGELVQAAGGRVAVHPDATAIEQDRPAHAVPDRPIDGPPDCWRQRHQDDLGALAAHGRTRWPCSSPRSAMSALVASKIRKPSRPSIGYQREVIPVRRLAGGGKQGFELQVGEPKGGRFGGDRGTADVLGR
jgi:hypothetical protein